MRMDWRLCCDTPQEVGLCACGDDVLFLGEVTEHILADNVQAYAEGAACGDCVFALTAACIPYREWVKGWAFREYHGMLQVADPVIDVPEQLSRCDNYRSITDE